MKTVFVGAVEGSLAALKALIKADHTPNLIVTLPSELSTRHSDFAELTPLAEVAGIPVHYTARSDGEETLKAIREVAPDIILVVGWSQLCGAEFRAIPKIGCLGFHPSLLPHLRGRGVVAWTVLLGETESGGTIFWLSHGADTGEIAAQASFPIEPESITARELYDRQVDAMCDMLPSVLTQIDSGEIPRIAQNEDAATICAKRTAEDGRIDWRASAEDIERLVRAVGDPYPGAFTETTKGERLVVDAARLTPKSGRFIGSPGQIQAIDGQRFTVFCGDGNCIDVLSWCGPEKVPGIHTKFRLGG